MKTLQTRINWHWRDGNYEFSIIFLSKQDLSNAYFQKAVVICSLLVSDWAEYKLVYQECTADGVRQAALYYSREVSNI
jgi:hypothetical protein